MIENRFLAMLAIALFLGLTLPSLPAAPASVKQSCSSEVFVASERREARTQTDL